jgi:hypothetical protein
MNLPSFTTADIPIPETGETLRVALERDRTGQPVHLHLALGVGTGRAWRETPEAGLAIPAGQASALAGAVLKLIGGEAS